jgi:predicted Ser/Thr protein kinase
MDIYELINRTTDKERSEFCLSLQERQVVGHGGSAGPVHEMIGEWNGFPVSVIRKKQAASNLLYFEYQNLLALYSLHGVPRPIFAKPPYLYIEFIHGVSLDKLSKKQWGMLEEEFAAELVQIWWSAQQAGYTHTDFHLHNVVVSTLDLRPYIIDWRHCELGNKHEHVLNNALHFCNKVYGSIKAHKKHSPCYAAPMLNDVVVTEQPRKRWWKIW